MISPIKTSPVFKDYIWGGNKLNTLYNKNSNSTVTAESWELATHKQGTSCVAEGKYKNLPLNEYIQKAGANILGHSKNSNNDLPILTKFIDAKESLSIQVHPDNDYAMSHENDNGKTEMWIVLESEPESFIYYGLNKSLTKEEFKSKLSDGTIESSLRKVPAKKGDIFFIPPGTIHAIGAGLVIYEIQQSSNVTYRLYDFDRKDQNGQKRKLHIKEALDVVNLDSAPVYKKSIATISDSDKNHIELLHACEYFSTFKYDIKKEVNFSSSKQSFIGLTVIEGNGELSYTDNFIPIKKGESLFLPAQEMDYKITGNLKFILIIV